jgi:hypothetical protein
MGFSAHAVGACPEPTDSRAAARFEMRHSCGAGVAKLNVGHSHLCSGFDCGPVIDSVTTMPCA